jgi:hypothetical protein
MADKIIEYFKAAGYRTEEQAFIVANVAMLIYQLQVRRPDNDDNVPLREIGDWFRERIVRLEEEYKALRQHPDSDDLVGVKYVLAKKTTH